MQQVPGSQNPGTFLLLSRKSKMRHKGVAHATPLCRTVILGVSVKVDYEGK